MRSDGTYPVLRCSRCKLIHPHRMRMCSRCGESHLAVAQVTRTAVRAAALEFVVADHEIAMPQALVEKLLARQDRTAVGTAEALAATASAVIARIRQAIPALRPRLVVGSETVAKKKS